MTKFDGPLQRRLAERREYIEKQEAQQKWVMRLILAVLTIASVCLVIDLIAVATRALGQ